MTRSRDGPLGKLKGIEALTQKKSSATIVDDNILVINECCRVIHTIHLHLRRKPWATAPDKVEHYLEDCGDHMRQKSTDRCQIGEKMTEFESRIHDSSESEQRSRSDRVV